MLTKFRARYWVVSAVSTLTPSFIQVLPPMPKCQRKRVSVRVKPYHVMR